MLRLRFLSYLTIEEASARMGYSYDAGKRLSAQAMRAARTIWEACQMCIRDRSLRGWLRKKSERLRGARRVI